MAERSVCFGPVRLNLHLQVAYPETIRRLQDGELKRKKTPRELKRFPLWEEAARAGAGGAGARRTSETPVGGREGEQG